MLEEINQLLEKYVNEIEQTRKKGEIKSSNCIDKLFFKEQNIVEGVYWIETNMPELELIKLLSNKYRKKSPKEFKRIEQKGSNFYIIYSGTAANIVERLKQHLFNLGHEKTFKLGCKIDELPYSKYKWRVSYAIIRNRTVRYAIEAKWREKYGWPSFCRR